jgi:hypothetical protein
MNVITSIIYYFFPTRESMSILIATPMAHTLSPLLVSYAVSSSIMVSPMTYLTSYVLIRPLSCITYWFIHYYEPTYIEMMPLRKNTCSQKGVVH